MEPNQAKPLLNIPVAIIIAGAIIAGAVIWVKRPAPVASTAQNKNQEVRIAVKPVSSTDHILGNPDAPIQVIEFSDPSCPFCKSFHPTMKTLMDEYGKDGTMAWVYRNFPLEFHKNAHHESQALECAADIGGNDVFWKYTNRLYEVTPAVTGQTPEGLDPKELLTIAKYVGLDVTQFNSCLESGKTKALVDEDRTDGINAGVTGTPSSVIILKKALSEAGKKNVMAVYEPYKNPQTGDYPIVIDASGKILSVNGAIPLVTMRATIELLAADSR